jgi:MoxR-like ATPase
MSNNEPNQIAGIVKERSVQWQSVRQEIKKVVVGQDVIVEKILAGFLCNGHILIEGVPGLAKTTLIKTIANVIDLSFGRVQFTPDLLPADLLGTLIYNPKEQEFQTKKGPIFTNILLADEINRAPAKVQSALLEAMQEYQVTIGSNTFDMGENFLVLATQNPIDQEGTYRLPEAQLDRFMFKLVIYYPSIEEEREVIAKKLNPQKTYKVINKDDIVQDKNLVSKVYVDEKVIDYILNIVAATRKPKKYKLVDLEAFIEYGSSPRATIALANAAKGIAFLRKRHFVIPDDVKSIALDVLRHRILLTYEAEAENISTDQIIQKILRTIPSP